LICTGCARLVSFKPCQSNSHGNQGQLVAIVSVLLSSAAQRVLTSNSAMCPIHKAMIANSFDSNRDPTVVTASHRRALPLQSPHVPFLERVALPQTVKGAGVKNIALRLAAAFVKHIGLYPDFDGHLHADSGNSRFVNEKRRSGRARRD